MSVISLSGLFAATVLLVAGCEVDPLSETISISPSAASIKQGQSVTFTASGGYEYQWSLPDSPKGSLSASTGQSVTYTCLYDPGSSNIATEILSVTSYIPGSGSSTNSVSSSNTVSSAQATITITSWE